MLPPHQAPTPVTQGVGRHPLGRFQSKHSIIPSVVMRFPVSFFLDAPIEPSHNFRPSHFVYEWSWQTGSRDKQHRRPHAGLCRMGKTRFCPFLVACRCPGGIYLFAPIEGGFSTGNVIGNAFLRVLPLVAGWSACGLAFHALVRADI